MKRIIFLLILFVSVQAFAQDSTKTKNRQWLGVLTLAEKFTTEANWTPADQAVVGEHFQRLLKKKEEGVVILAGRMDLPLNDPEMKGLVIFNAKDEREAQQFMQDDPAVKAKIMLAKVYPYGVAVSKCN
ncbi:MAG: hypothetical protein JNM88_06595 [Chitinophagaceae bacterium]|nr:hypothetical protein [Chitinophagaceae bacterium]